MDVACARTMANASSKRRAWSSGGAAGKFVSFWNFRDGMGTRIGTFTETCCVGHGCSGQARECEGGDKSSIEGGERREEGVNAKSNRLFLCTLARIAILAMSGSALALL